MNINTQALILSAFTVATQPKNSSMRQVATQHSLSVGSFAANLLTELIKAAKAIGAKNTIFVSWVRSQQKMLPQIAPDLRFDA